MAQATIQLGTLVAQIRTIVENACKALAEAISRNCSPAHDLAGIRQTALDNAEALWPMLNPRSAHEALPNFRIIVFGTVPRVRAEIIYKDANAHNIISVRGPQDVSAEAAVEGLLETTMKAVDQRYQMHVFKGNDVRWTSARLPHATGSGWYGQ